jgi:VWA domain-containing protein/TROVE domain-containing protein
VRTNVPVAVPEIVTHEGGRAARITTEQELRRTIMACLLWEDSFYEDGVSIAERISALVKTCRPEVVAALAIEARTSMNLRHVPLLLCRELARNKRLRAETLAAVIQRADELAEFLAIYWNDGRTPLASQVKKGLALAFQKFNEYALAKYNRDGAVKLRDVLFLCHAKAKDAEQDALWKRLIAGELATPDTWEVAISAGHVSDKQANWTRLLTEKKLGALALLRNLRNMTEAKVEPALIRAALAEADVRRVLPFRFVAAARFAPNYEPDLEACLFRALSESPKLKGHTALLVDVSGSMDEKMSAKSDMTRMDAACGLAMVARELCEQVGVVTFSDQMAVVAPRRGFALRDAVTMSLPHRGTYLAQAIKTLNDNVKYDRLIVVSDEQVADGVTAPHENAKAYMLNVGTYKNGVGYGRRWTHIDGFSEACVRYIIESER